MPILFRGLPGKLDEGAADLPVFGFAEKIAFLGGVVVIAANKRATAIGREGGGAHGSLGETVEMSGKNRLQIERFESFQERVRIGWPHLHFGPERKMSKYD